MLSAQILLLLRILTIQINYVFPQMAVNRSSNTRCFKYPNLTEIYTSFAHRSLLFSGWPACNGEELICYNQSRPCLPWHQRSRQHILESLRSAINWTGICREEGALTAVEHLQYSPEAQRRSPNDKFYVKHGPERHLINWDKTNLEMNYDHFQHYNRRPQLTFTSVIFSFRM